MDTRTPEDRAVLAFTTAALAAGTATPAQIAAAYAVVDAPSDAERTLDENAIVDAAVRDGIVQESYLETAFDASIAEATLPVATLRRSRRAEVLSWVRCPEAERRAAIVAAAGPDPADAVDDAEIVALIHEALDRRDAERRAAETTGTDPDGDAA